MSRHRVEVREVGPRDGLQSLPRVVALDDKVAMVRGLARAGVRRIEVGSYVSPRAVPAMADTPQVVAAVRDPALSVEVLVVNRIGAVRAAQDGADVLVTLLAASETFAAKNVRSTVAGGLAHAAEAARIAADAGTRCVATVSTAFGCAYEGPVAPDAVVRTVAGATAAGITEVTLCDTVGMASPGQVRALVGRVRAETGPGSVLGLHLHDTRGLGLANALAGLEAGVRLFDASIGGIGGCPFSPGATGNVCTEDLVHLLELEGYDTGIDLVGLIDAGRSAAGRLAVPPRSGTAVAGPSWMVGSGAPGRPTVSARGLLEADA